MFQQDTVPYPKEIYTHLLSSCNVVNDIQKDNLESRFAFSFQYVTCNSKKCFLSMTNNWSLKLDKYYRMFSHQKAATGNSHDFFFKQALYSYDWSPTLTVKKYEKAKLSTCSAKLLLVISISFCSSRRLSNNTALLLGMASAYKNKPRTLSDANKRCEKCKLQIIYLK